MARRTGTTGKRRAPTATPERARAADEERPREAPRSPRVAIVRGTERGTVFPLIIKETLIGRIDSNHLVIDDKSVSRVHARLLREHDGVYVEDLGSKQGTLVNGARITRARLREGDEITLGDVALVYSD
jgi:pSer/pThr/pTyr-binding forkhead associated (FHA) protein